MFVVGMVQTSLIVSMCAIILHLTSIFSWPPSETPAAPFHQLQDGREQTFDTPSAPVEGMLAEHIPRVETWYEHASVNDDLGHGAAPPTDPRNPLRHCPLEQRCHQLPERHWPGCRSHGACHRLEIQ